MKAKKTMAVLRFSKFIFLASLAIYILLVVLEQFFSVKQFWISAASIIVVIFYLTASTTLYVFHGRKLKLALEFIIVGGLIAGEILGLMGNAPIILPIVSTIFTLGFVADAIHTSKLFQSGSPPKNG